MDASELLDMAVADLALVQDLEQAQHIIRSAARRLANAHGSTVVLLEEGHCFYADEDAVSPLWKGQRFPVQQCISGWSMLNRQPAIVPDIQFDERVPQEAYRPTFVKSLVIVPMRVGDPLGAIGAYWIQPHRVTDEELARLQALAGAAGAALTRLMASPAPDMVGSGAIGILV
ncbi:GAF domain-containing protein [Dactylosporangium aurantiacum]|uniref:GAF domain-containing protein n=1 Tax=Dactylosporangium aurantiacum TaxID=35754 RepID=A0A9Q9IJ38_9ACTN|nr:GAF domain-containing protein [Dactylosporangium aurantiacum]MDG6105585.1 GAF domain-containing protein [Dactylosporangium aurantiacum]UWZ57074.1 GAF domain-containing protein [Dactylosporangium aurantiacum]